MTVLIADDTYLASVFGNHDGLIEAVVPLLDVSNEIRRFNIVPVKSNEIKLKK